MARAGIRGIVFGLAAAGFLMGCVDGGGTGGEGPGVTSTPAKKKSGAQDVEAPDVFDATESALWDGRPSLGGIWVAAPEVTNPERAIMFNPATGKSVTGALFKRERENPGPRLQLSSDAAEALGILAGQPTEIRVTALRKAEAVEDTPAEETAAEDTATETAEGEAEPAKEDEAAAIAAAALTAVDAEKPEAAPEAAAADPAADPAAVAATAAGAAAVAAAVVDEKPKRKTWKERRAEAKAAREAKKQAAAEAKAAASAAEADAALAAGEAPTATAESAAVAPIESAPLDARKPELDVAPAIAASEAAPAEPAKPKRNTVGQTQTPAPAPVAEAPAAEEAPAVAAGPVRPIQVASFSKEDNAKRAAEALAKIGITATPQKSEKAGKAVWGVIVQGDGAMLKKIKDAGFADAYFLK
jgi:rare lipoprotein A